MARQIVTDDIGQVKLGDTLLPGVFEGLEVEGELEIDEQDVQGGSKRKQVLGFHDPTVTLKLRLLNDAAGTPHDKLRVIAALFRGKDKAGKPVVYRIVNQHLALWGIQQVLFKRLRTSESNLDDSLRAELEFTGHSPVVVKKQGIGGGKGKGTVPKGMSQREMLNYLAGKPVYGPPVPKKAKTPAVDNDRPRG